MKNYYPFLAVFFILIASTAALTQDPDDKKWLPKDIIHTESARSLSFSPDGKAVVWTKSKGVKDKEKDKFMSDIYLTRLDMEKDGEYRTFQMTNQDESDHSPLFSKNSEDIYFLSSRDKGKKLWKMSIYGGEPKEVHEFKNGISNLQWLDDENLAFLSNDGKTLYDEENEKDNTKVIEDSIHWKISQVYSFNLKEKQITRLTNNNHPISSYKISHNGQLIVTRLRMSPHYGVDGSPKPRTELYNLTTNESSTIIRGYQQPSGYQFDAKDERIYFKATTSSNPEWEGAGKSELYYYNIANNAISKVDLQWEMGLSFQGFKVVGDNVIATLANKTTNILAFYKPNKGSWSKQVIDFGTQAEHVRLLNTTEDGSKFAYAYSRANLIPEYYVAGFQSTKKDASTTNPRQFVKLNKKLKKKPITKSEVIYWNGANGAQVNGVLYYPENYTQGEKYALVISIHGGPTGTDMDSWSERWSTYPQIFAQRGAFVLKPNYHGSGNHGQVFAESIKGHYYDLEEVDLLNGIKHLDDLGYIDKDKMGIMGWSNGAILATMMTIRHPDMFKVAAAGAGDVNWTSDYGTCQFGVTFDQSYFGGAPWDDTNGKFYNEAYITKSPIFEIEKIKTPTIIFHGSEDRAVPRDQGWEYYRGLQQVGIAPVRFLWFPGQPHGLQKLTHQMRKMKEELRWFDTYLFETYKPENEALKKDSPLALKLETSNLASHEGNYGVVENNVLTAEMVSLGTDSISISRFEITNAQYQAVISNHAYPSGTDNYPVVNLSKEQVNEFIGKLNTATNKNYRLPNKNEAEKLAKQAYKTAPKENSLNLWAGYDITKNEVAMLSEKLSGLNSSLIKEVGQFEASKVNGKKIYDLGGNVAEYYFDNGQLKTYGYSAYDYVDPNSRENNPKKEHTGLRLVIE